MDTTLITHQLRREITTSLLNKALQQERKPTIVPRRTWQTQALQSQQLVVYVYDKLHDIMRRNHIVFTSKQEEERFINSLEPEINNIIIHHIPD
jgi:hypothetical protein